MIRSRSCQTNQKLEQAKHAKIEAESKRNLRILIKEHQDNNQNILDNKQLIVENKQDNVENKQNNVENKQQSFIENNNKEEYDQHDEVDYSNLDKWKKDHHFKDANYMRNKIKKIFSHIQSVKDEITMPEINYDIIDSVMNPKYYGDDNDQSTQNINQNNQSNNLMKRENQSTYQKQQSNIASTSLSNHNKNYNSKHFQDSVNEKSPRQTKWIANQTEETYNQNAQMFSPKNQDSKCLSSSSSKIINSQSSIFMYRNINKQLLNKLLLERITKKYQNSQKIETQSETEKSRNQKKQKIQFLDQQIEGNSFQKQENKHKNKTYSKIREILSEESKTFSKTTLNSFKNVGNQFFRLESVIEYDNLLKDIINQIYHPKGIFKKQSTDAAAKEDLCFDLDYFNYFETTLQDNYQHSSKEIEMYNSKIREERLFQTSIRQENENCNEEMKNQLNRIQNQIETFKKQIENFQNFQVIQHAQSTKMNAIRFKNFQNLDIKERYRKKQEEFEEVSLYFENLKKTINQRMKVSSEKLAIMEKEILNVKQKRNTTKVILKDLYYKQLKSDSQLSTKSLVLIIKSLININEDLSNTNIFPSFLDEQSKEFLIQWAKLIIQSDRIQEQIKGVQIDNINVQEQYQNWIFEQSKAFSGNSKEQIQKKVHKYAKSSIVQSKQSEQSSNSGYAQSQDQVNDNCYDEMSDKGQGVDRIAFDLNLFPKQCIQTIETKNNMRQELVKINNVIDCLKENEQKRLCKQNNTSSAKGYQHKLTILQQILQVLFGRNEGEAIMNRHLKEMSLFDEKINSIKFFKFSQMNIQNMAKKISNQQNQNGHTFNTLNSSRLNLKADSSFISINNITHQQSNETNDGIKQIQNRQLYLSNEVIDHFRQNRNSISNNQKTLFQYNQLNSLFSHRNLVKSNEIYSYQHGNYSLNQDGTILNQSIMKQSQPINQQINQNQLFI